MILSRPLYSVTYYRLLLLAGAVSGDIMSVDATRHQSQTLTRPDSPEESLHEWNSICAWGPTALLPIFQLLGTEYSNKQIATHFLDEAKRYDAFTIRYPSSILIP